MYISMYILYSLHHSTVCKGINDFPFQSGRRKDLQMAVEDFRTTMAQHPGMPPLYRYFETSSLSCRVLGVRVCALHRCSLLRFV